MCELLFSRSQQEDKQWPTITASWATTWTLTLTLNQNGNPAVYTLAHSITHPRTITTTCPCDYPSYAGNLDYIDTYSLVKIILPVYMYTYLILL